MHRTFLVSLAVALFGYGATLSGSVEDPRADWPYCGTVDVFPGERWPSANPGQHWDLSALRRLSAQLDRLDSAAMMVVHRGRPIFSWGDIAARYDMASLRKSVASALIGSQIRHAQLGLDTTLADAGIDESTQPLPESAKAATLQDLMSARSGIYRSAHYEMGSWKRAKQSVSAYAQSEHGRPSLPPGSYWLYNNWDFNAATYLMEQRLNDKIGPLFLRAIANPTGMQDFRVGDVSYVGNESYAERRMGNLSDVPAFMFTMSTRDLARIGVLYLNCGRWENSQLIPSDWIHRSTAGRPIRDGAPSSESFHHDMGDYGLMWWVDKPGSRTWPGLKTREPVYFGQGYRGHYLWVAPYLDLVVVHQVATTGGIGTWGQVKRRVFGSDEVSDDEFVGILQSILSAHPQRETAFTEE